jgi:hypothetical protein
MTPEHRRRREGPRFRHPRKQREAMHDFSFAMKLQSAGVGGPSIALMLGHESPASSRPYLHADLELKQRALDRTAPPNTRTGRYTPPDKLLAFLESL